MAQPTLVRKHTPADHSSALPSSYFRPLTSITHLPTITSLYLSPIHKCAKVLYRHSPAHPELRARRKDAAPSTPAAADRNVHQGHGGERQGCRSAGTSSSPALRSEGQDRRAQKGDVGSAATAAAGNERATASVAAGKGKDRGRWPERRGAPSAAAFGWWNEGTASP
jgi:hypothetical protein